MHSLEVTECEFDTLTYNNVGAEAMVDSGSSLTFLFDEYVIDEGNSDPCGYEIVYTPVYIND